MNFAVASGKKGIDEGDLKLAVRVFRDVFFEIFEGEGSAGGFGGSLVGALTDEAFGGKAILGESHRAQERDERHEGGGEGAMAIVVVVMLAAFVIVAVIVMMVMIAVPVMMVIVVMVVMIVPAASSGSRFFCRMDNAVEAQDDDADPS